MADYVAPATVEVASQHAVDALISNIRFSAKTEQDRLEMFQLATEVWCGAVQTCRCARWNCLFSITAVTCKSNKLNNTPRLPTHPERQSRPRGHLCTMPTVGYRQAKPLPNSWQNQSHDADPEHVSGSHNKSTHLPGPVRPLDAARRPIPKGTDFYMTSLNAQTVIDEWNNGINLVDILEIMLPQVWCACFLVASAFPNRCDTRTLIFCAGSGCVVRRYFEVLLNF